MFFQLVITRRSNGFPPLLFATGPSDSACNNFCWHSCLSWNCLDQNDGAMIRNSHYESAGTSIKPHLHAFSPWRPWSVVSGSESPISGQDTNKDVEITWVPPPWHIPSSAYPRHQVKAKNERLHPHLRRWRSELLNWGNWNSLFNAMLFFERLTCSKQYPHGSVWKLGTQKKDMIYPIFYNFPLKTRTTPYRSKRLAIMGIQPRIPCRLSVVNSWGCTIYVYYTCIPYLCTISIQIYRMPCEYSMYAVSIPYYIYTMRILYIYYMYIPYV